MKALVMDVGVARIQRRLFTVREYERMVEAAVFGEDDRLELIEGEVVAMSPVGAAHAGRVKKLNALLASRLGRRAIISVQDPLRLDRSEPQPDLALLRPRPDYYSDTHPRPDEVWLVIEVADTTADYDRTVKIPLYAAAGIAEAWLVDLHAGCVEVCRAPSAAGYGEKRTAAGADTLSPLAFPDVILKVSEVLRP